MPEAAIYQDGNRKLDTSRTSAQKNLAANERIEAMKMKKAAAVTAATQKKRHSKGYPKADSLSSWKMLIGGLLLFGNKQQKVFWPFFDAMLRQYVDLRISQSAFQGRSGGAGATI